MCTSGVCATKSVLFGSSKQHRQHARGFHSSLLMQAGCSLGHSPLSDGDAIYKSLQLCCDWLDADVTQACNWLSSQRLPRNPFVNRLLLRGAQSPHHQGVWRDRLSYWWGIAILKWLIIQVMFAPPPTLTICHMFFFYSCWFQAYRVVCLTVQQSTLCFICTCK